MSDHQQTHSIWRDIWIKVILKGVIFGTFLTILNFGLRLGAAALGISFGGHRADVWRSITQWLEFQYFASQIIFGVSLCLLLAAIALFLTRTEAKQRLKLDA